MEGLRVAITGGTSGLGLRARPRTARPRRPCRLRRAQPRGRGTCLPASGPTRTASSATSRGRRTSIRSRYRCSARWAASTCSSTTPRRSGPCRSSRSPTPNAKTWSCALATNVLGPFRLTKALLGALAASAREGVEPLVVNVSSDAAVNPYPNWGAYGASKAALHHLSRIWNEELAAEGIRVIVPRPGRHGHAAARARRARCGPLDPETPGTPRRGNSRM